MLDDVDAGGSADFCLYLPFVYILVYKFVLRKVDTLKSATLQYDRFRSPNRSGLRSGKIFLRSVSHDLVYLP